MEDFSSKEEKFEQCRYNFYSIVVINVVYLTGYLHDVHIDE